MSSMAAEHSVMTSSSSLSVSEVLRLRDLKVEKQITLSGTHYAPETFKM